MVVHCHVRPTTLNLSGSRFNDDLIDKLSIKCSAWSHTTDRAQIIYQLQRTSNKYQQESRAVARIPRDATAVVFGLKFAHNIHYKFKSSQASKARLQSSKHTVAKQNLTQKGHSSSVFWSQWKGDKAISNTICWRYLLSFW